MYALVKPVLWVGGVVQPLANCQLLLSWRLSLSYDRVVRSIWSFYAAVSITSLAKRCRGIGEYSATIRICPSSEKFRWTASHRDTNTACHHRHFLCMSSMFRDTVWKTTTNGVRRSEAENVFDHGVSWTVLVSVSFCLSVCRSAYLSLSQCVAAFVRPPLRKYIRLLLLAVSLVGNEWNREVCPWVIPRHSAVTPSSLNHSVVTQPLLAT